MTDRPVPMLRLPRSLQFGGLALSVVLALASVLQLAWLVASLWRRQTRAVTALTDQLRALRAGDLTRDVGATGGDALGTAASEAQRLS